MGGFSDFLTGGVLAGTAGVEQQVQEDNKLLRDMSLEEYRQSRKAHWAKLTRAEAYAESIDPARVAAAEAASNRASELKIKQQMTPNALLLAEQKKDIAVEQATDITAGNIEKKLSYADKVRKQEILDAINNHLDTEVAMEAFNLREAGDFSIASFNAHFGLDIDTGGDLAELNAAKVKYGAEQIGWARDSATMLQSGAVMRAARDMIEFMPTVTKADRTTRDDLIANVTNYSTAVAGDDKNATAVQYYGNVMRGIAKAGKNMEDGAEHKAELMNFGARVQRSMDELVMLKRQINQHGPALRFTDDIKTLYDRFTKAGTAGGLADQNFTMFNIPGLQAANAKTATEGERGVPPQNAGRAGVQEGPPGQALLQQQEGPPPPAPAAPAVQPILATQGSQLDTIKQAIAENISSKGLDPAAAEVELKRLVKKALDSGLIPEQEVAKILDEIKALMGI